MSKVIHSLLLHISHQMRSYSSAKVIWWLSYTCYLGTWALGQFLRKGPNTPKSSTESHKKRSKVFNSLFHIKRDLTLVSRSSLQGHMKNNPKSSGSCFTSNRPCSSVRALCGSSYTCFTGTWVLGQFGETGPKHPKSGAGTHEK